MSKHTPTPWALSDDSSAYMEGTLVVDPGSDVEIAGVWKESDARYIVHCVNHHEQLVEALERLVEDVDRATHVEFGGTPWLKEKMAEIDYARALLAELENLEKPQ